MREISLELWSQTCGWISQFYLLLNVFDVLGTECRPMLLALPADDLRQLHDRLWLVYRKRCAEGWLINKYYFSELSLLTLTKELSLFLVDKIPLCLVRSILDNFRCKLFDCDETQKAI